MRSHSSRCCPQYLEWEGRGEGGEGNGRQASLQAIYTQEGLVDAGEITTGSFVQLPLCIHRDFIYKFMTSMYPLANADLVRRFVLLVVSCMTNDSFFCVLFQSSVGSVLCGRPSKNFLFHLEISFK